MNAQRREELLARFEASGMTQKAFAKREGVNIHTFVAWLADKRRADGTSKGREQAAPRVPTKFVELSAPVRSAAIMPVMEIVLRDGRIVRGAHAVSLVALAKLLDA